MTIFDPGSVAAAGLGMACGATCILAAQLARAASNVPSAEAPLPWFMRTFRTPAALMAPAVQLFLPEGQARRIEQSLGAVELETTFTPASWIGLRCAHGILAAMLAVIVAVSSSLPVWPAACAGSVAGFAFGGLWMRSSRRELERCITRELPSYLDLLTVCVEAGATLTAGVKQITDKAPDSPLRRYFEHVLREVRGGRPRAQAFERVAGLYAVPALSTLAVALAHAESSGISLGGILRAQGQQRIAERFTRAEKLAMQAPVKLLGPLILCIFPCTFIVLSVPIVVRLSQALSS